MKKKTFDIIFIAMTVVSIVISVGIIYAAIHFISKYW